MSKDVRYVSPADILNVGVSVMSNNKLHIHDNLSSKYTQIVNDNNDVVMLAVSNAATSKEQAIANAKLTIAAHELLDECRNFINDPSGIDGHYSALVEIISNIDNE